MSQDNKKRHIVSIENMSPELAEAFAEKYPKGFSDYLGDIVKYTKPDGTPFYAVLMEIEDLEKWLEGEEEAEVEQVTGTVGASDEEGNTLPDDNIAQYGSDDEPAETPEGSSE